MNLWLYILSHVRNIYGTVRASDSPYVFTSERGGPMSAAGFRKQLARWGVKARSLQAYLGHASITHTVRYTEMSPTRFKAIWLRSPRMPSRRPCRY